MCVSKRRELGEVGEVFVPLISDAGVEGEVDWGQAQVRLRGELVDVHLFEMRACFSGAAFVMAFRDETQQAFLEGHVRALEWHGGVFDVLRYDNLKSAVARVLRGRRRVESDRFVALRSHYRFESSFCLPGVQGAHEKGGVEGDIGQIPPPSSRPGAGGRPRSRSSTSCSRRRAGLIWIARSPAGQRRSGSGAIASGCCWASLPREEHPTWEEATPRVDARRWRPSARTATRCRPRWPG